MPRSSCSVNHPPILIEIQQRVDMHFIKRLMLYGLSLSIGHKIAPIILVIPVADVTNDVSKLFKDTASISPLRCAPHQTGWCLSAYIFPIRSQFEEYSKTCTSMEVIGVFFQGKSRTITNFENLRNNETMRKLYQVANKKALVDFELEEQAVEAPHTMADTMEELLEKVTGCLEANQIARARQYLHQGTVYCQTTRRKYQATNG